MAIQTPREVQYHTSVSDYSFIPQSALVLIHYHMI